MKTFGQRHFHGIKMANANKKLLLQVVYSKSDVMPLVRRGLLYSQILDLLNECLAERLVERKGKQFELTDEGVTFLKQASNELEGRTKDMWISPLKNNRIEKISCKDVFIPKIKRQKELD